MNDGYLSGELHRFTQTFTLNNLQFPALRKDHLLHVTSKRTCFAAKSRPSPFLFISIISHLLPSFFLCLVFIISFSLICVFCPPPAFSPPLSWWRSSGLDSMVPDGLAGRGFRSDPEGQLILSYLKPPGVREGAGIPRERERGRGEEMRGRGQERDSERGGWEENCITTEPVIDCLSSSNSFLQSARTLSCLKHKHTLCYHSSAVQLIKKGL